MREAPRRLVPLLLSSLALIAVANSPASAQGSICSSDAEVSWGTDWDELTVDEVIVKVGDCDDGEQVGVQLIADGGSRPEAGPRGGVVADGTAVVDVTDLDVDIEGLTGIRVFLILDGIEVEFLSLHIEQRFFAPAGNEQRGLRATYNLRLKPGGTYLVPTASTGYRDVACADVSSEIGREFTTEGSGRFIATTAATHVVCYQQLQGAPGAPVSGGPGAEPPVVLDEVHELAPDSVSITDDAAGGDDRSGGIDTDGDEDAASDEVQVLGSTPEGGSESAGPQALSRTGVGAAVGALSGLLLVGFGAAVLRRFRTAS